MTAEAVEQVRTETPHPSVTSVRSPASASRGRWSRWLCGAAAIVLILLAGIMPVWQARLSAPQYPQGLSLTAYGHGKVVGDIDEINELNHYVGMKAFSTADVPETVLWWPTIGIAVLGALLLSLIARPRWLRAILLAGMWAVPVGALLDVQFRLYEYGHSVQPDAAIRLDPFTPWVIGKTTVLNFTTWAYPGLGTLLLFLAAAILTFGPRLVARALPTHEPEPSEAS